MHRIEFAPCPVNAFAFLEDLERAYWPPGRELTAADWALIERLSGKSREQWEREAQQWRPRAAG